MCVRSQPYVLNAGFSNLRHLMMQMLTDSYQSDVLSRKKGRKVFPYSPSITENDTLFLPFDTTVFSGISEQQRTGRGCNFSAGFVTRSCFFSGNCVSLHAEGEPRQDFPMKQLQGLIISWALPDYSLKKRAYLSILYYFRSYQYGAS